ncbi:MarR family winged helix-turn-helix transcriptional regulator [Streptomyces sp. SCA3-4]|uniref:MarR family winged helix-turn-helix transcriptional regulator n=1 Tax=Streptomyces sichuanensis TaxID=2871810 RepID=UPI001CE39427|nr:MarR family winged helix-turn-helix transcriptional regulator [Streptomyces sichuanensis]MCA6091494.1 MarR family winged helix-turn-helix transcriptional regulator [Streptomyces sichuanensis]
MKPIGYWLNRTDKALTRYMDAMLGEFGLTRLAWQVLNVVQDAGEATDAGVLSALAANADRSVLAVAIETVLADGWATRPAPGRLALTPGGRRRLTEVAERVDAFRALCTDGISPEEYRTAVRVLERMTRNLSAPGLGRGCQP